MTQLRNIAAWAWLALFSAYQVAGFFESREDAQGPLSASIGNIFWPVNWHMFTTFSHSNTALVFQGAEGQDWKDLPMEQWYPAHWESGYRWERPAVYKNPGRNMRAFLEAACARSGAPATRMVKITWKKKLGRMVEPGPDAERTVLATLVCRGGRTLPPGKVF